MRPLVIAVPLLLIGAWCGQGAEEIVAKVTSQPFWGFRARHGTGFVIGHQGCGYIVSPADLAGTSLNEFLAKDELKKQSLATVEQVPQAEANHYYGWNVDRLKAKWGVPVTTFTVTAGSPQIIVGRRASHMIYTGGRRVDLCMPGDPSVVAPNFQSFRMLAYYLDDENHLTGVFIYGKGKTVSGGLFKGVPILNPNGDQQPEDLRRQEKEKAQLLSWARSVKKDHDAWPETARKINAEIEERRRAQAEDFGL